MPAPSRPPAWSGRRTEDSPIEQLVAGYGRFAGRPLTIDAEVLDSERTTGHRNRAIGQLLRASGAIDGDVDGIVERYFAQCSVSVTAADLAVIAATLANGGVNPLTGERAISAASTQAVLAVMATCGMYDGAGEWLYSVGLPAKSGVSGGIMVVVPGQLGYRRLLAAAGRGRQQRPRGARLPRPGARPRAPPAARRRTAAGTDPDELHPGRDRLQARSDASPSEPPSPPKARAAGSWSSRASSRSWPPTPWRRPSPTPGPAAPLDIVVLDMRRVERLEPAGLDLLAALLAGLTRSGIEVLVSGRQRLGDAVAGLERAIASHDGGPLHATDELDTALEAAEERLLDAADLPIVDLVGLADQALVRGLGSDRPGRRGRPPGAPVVRAGRADRRGRRAVA